MTPENVSQLDKKDFTPYERVGEENEGWVNGSTPINADNLNKGDVALFNLLNGSNGYVYQLIDKLNTEILARLRDSRNLNSAISFESTTRRQADNELRRDIPTKVGQLTNDKGYITEHQSLDNYYTKAQTDSAIDEAIADIEIPEVDLKHYAKVEDIPTKVSQLQNDKGYLTSHQSLDNYVTTEQLEAKNYVKSETFNTQAIKTEDELILNCGSSIENIFD